MLAHGQLRSRSRAAVPPELLTPTEYEIEARPYTLRPLFGRSRCTRIPTAARGRPSSVHLFLTNFLTSPRKSAPYTLPSKSEVTPSAMLEPPAYGYGHGSGMRYFTEPSCALPILMPRSAPRL